MSFKLSNFKKPTPAKWEKFGKALLRASIFLSSSAILSNHTTLALIVLLMGGTGEFITYFFAEDDDAKPVQ